MKTSFELAMERLGGKLRQYTDEQKEKLSEIDRAHDAREAEARLRADDRLRAAAGEAEKEDAVRQDLAVELASLSSQREKKKEELRRQFGA